VNLDTLTTEIQQYLEESGIAIFHGHTRALESTPTVYWDCEQYPDYKQFIRAAQTAGTTIMVLHQHRLGAEQVDDALEELAECDFPREEMREYKRRLTQLRAHEGQTCTIELSFDHEGRVFLYDLRTDWYEELSDIQQEIDLMSASAGDDDAPLGGGYYSKN
jgi:hypothetical protein